MSTQPTGGFAAAVDFFAAAPEEVAPERLGDVSGVVCFEIVDAGIWTMTIENGAATVITGEAASWDARIVTDEEHFLSIVGGQASARRLFMRGAVKVRGKLALAIKLDKLLAPTG